MAVYQTLDNHTHQQHCEKQSSCNLNSYSCMVSTEDTGKHPHIVGICFLKQIAQKQSLPVSQFCTVPVLAGSSPSHHHGSVQLFRIQLHPCGFLPVSRCIKRQKATPGPLEEEANAGGVTGQAIRRGTTLAMCSKKKCSPVFTAAVFYPLFASVLFCPCLWYSGPDLHSVILQMFAWHLQCTKCA